MWPIEEISTRNRISRLSLRIQKNENQRRSENVWFFECKLMSLKQVHQASKPPINITLRREVMNLKKTFGQGFVRKEMKCVEHSIESVQEASESVYRWSSLKWLTGTTAYCSFRKVKTQNGVFILRSTFVKKRSMMWMPLESIRFFSKGLLWLQPVWIHQKKLASWRLLQTNEESIVIFYFSIQTAQYDLHPVQV